MVEESGEVVEAVAQAISLKMQEIAGGTRFVGLWAKLTPTDKTIATALAIAAIRAMERESTTNIE